MSEEKLGVVFLRRGLVALSLVLFVLGAWMVYRTEAAASASSFGGAALCFILAHLREFKRISGFGIHAERLEEKVREADDVLSKTRSLAAMISGPVLTIAARLGRWDSGFSRKEAYDLMTRTEALLKENGVPQEQIDEALRDFNLYTLFDMSRPLYQAIFDITNERVQEKEKALSSFPMPIPAGDQEHHSLVEACREAHEAQSRLTDLFKLENVESLPLTLEQAIRDTPILDADEKAKLIEDILEDFEDVKYFAENKDFRRLEYWFSGDEK